MLQIRLETPGRFAALDATAAECPEGHALVRVHRIGVCGTDLHAFRGRQPFFSYPRVLGHELGVQVVDPGSGGGPLSAGDRCAVEPYLNCGTCIACRHGRTNCCTKLSVLGVHQDGGMQEMIAVPRHKLHASSRLSYEQLALVETLAIGAHAVERAALLPGEFVLVIGAGPIGLSVVEFARTAGARVAVLDTSAARLELCQRHWNLDYAIDAQSPAADAQVREVGGGDLPAVVFDATGNPRSMCAAFQWPCAGGRLVFVGLVQGDITFNDPEFHRRELTLLATRNARPESFRSIIQAIESGLIDTNPWITHRLGLGDVPAQFPAIAAAPDLFKAMVVV
jgi:2-desacetyl-2-hydroxyethyl bacteriochlorophyllide A dehydrogenase